MSHHSEEHKQQSEENDQGRLADAQYMSSLLNDDIPTPATSRLFDSILES